MRLQRRLFPFAIAVAVALSLAGCADSGLDGSGGHPFGDGTIGFGGGVPGSEGPGSDGGALPAANEGDKPSDDAPAITLGDGIELIFLHDVTQPLHVQTEAEVPILVKAISYASGGPAEGTLLVWEIIDAAGPGAPGDAEFSNDVTITDDDGLASVKFRGNSIGDVLYTIEVVADDAQPKTLQIMVGDPPTSDLKVFMSYEGPIPLNTVRVQVIAGDFKCSIFNPVTPPIDTLGEKTVLDPEAQPTFYDLLAEQKVTVVATAKGPNGNLAGAGCVDGIYLEGDKTNEVDLDLYVLVLNPAGTYDLTNAFDLTGAIPGQVGDVLDALATLFYDPGEFLVDQIKNLVKEFIGGLLTDLIFGIFEDQLSDLISDWVLNDSPEWIQDFFTIGQDIFQVIAKLQLTGELKISKLVSDYYVQGEIIFDGIIFTWKLNCDENAPDFEECGNYPFELEDIDNPDFPLEVLTGQWTGMVISIEELQIDPHTVALNYGKLILFVLHNLVLKELTGEDNLVDAVAAMIGCESIADALDNLGIDEEDIYDACLGAVALLVLPLESYLLGLETDSLVKLRGDARLNDDDDDLVVDRIEPGTWDGEILFEGEGSNPFDGTWEAVRQVEGDGG